MKTSFLVAAAAALVVGVWASPTLLNEANIDSISADRAGSLWDQDAGAACGPDYPCNTKRDIEGIEEMTLDQDAEVEEDMEKGRRGRRPGRGRGRRKGKGRKKGMGKLMGLGVAGLL
ncbi:hypothetical protein HIM_08807 [Hirsutella minnesotensis 3608]|uniref:Uncharacterized protein n=1 Tax=Hirsutella minnesotensis 3608 TaxID=1043627 RepID=A0A0F7ZY36_9HYPO|nr:hypothetical protein HIM_08807 [Hirsutella minnesotensis 3608]